ncbi:MAG: hypothetical protein U9N49_02895 [Campylobacterota bacterium]|nr:hypothetical protein [Campylobacterota bacterium]
MKKIIILFVLCFNSLFAQINEYKVDLYYSTNIILKGDKKDGYISVSG